MTENRANDLSGKEWLQYSFSIWRDFKKTQEEKEYKHPASFPVALCERIIRTFTKKGSSVLDPFNGIGSSMVAAMNLDCNGIGIDLSNEFCDIAKVRIGNNRNIKIICGDSLEELRKLDPESIDICLTSPPYWNILNMKRTADSTKNIPNYSNKNNDIGNIDSYYEFLDSLKSIFTLTMGVLKPGSYCIINVMDIRKKNVFFSLHSDLARVMQEIGYIFDDIIIWDRQGDYNNMRPLGYPYKFRINKVHEYILIFQKDNAAHEY